MNAPYLVLMILLLLISASAAAALLPAHFPPSNGRPTSIEGATNRITNRQRTANETATKGHPTATPMEDNDSPLRTMSDNSDGGGVSRRAFLTSQAQPP